MFILIFTIYGVISFNANFMSKKETFAEESIEKDVLSDSYTDKISVENDYIKDKAPTSIRTSLDGSVNSTKSSLSDEMIEELSTKIENNFNSLKESLAKQMDSTKELIDSSIKEFVHHDSIESPSSKEQPKKMLPTVRSFESEPVSDGEASDDEVSDEEESDDEDYTENFQDPLLYEGVASPYCLSCHSI